MLDLICKLCGATRKPGRRLCSACNSKRILQYPRYTWTKVCAGCEQEFVACRKQQTICKSCYTLQQALKAKTINTNNYARATDKKGKHEHREIVEKQLGRSLAANEVIHHLDENPKNNKLDNLVVLSRRNHGQLHQFLDLHRLKLELTEVSNKDIYWTTYLCLMLTEIWLKEHTVAVIRLI